jgi:predicted DNA repair protein MutK
MTVGVYGLVALIVKLDDIGEHLIKKTSTIAKLTGKALLLSAPKLMKLLSVLGTAAMFLVGGEIVTHGIEPVHHALEHWAGMAGSIDWLVSTLLKMVAGVLVGALVLLVWTPIAKLLLKKP